MKFTFQEILLGVKERDRKLEKVLVLTYSKYWYTIICRYNEKEDSQDILQDTLVAIFKYIKSFEGNEHQFLAWGKKIAISQSIKFNKKHKKLGILNDIEDSLNISSVEVGAISQLQTKDILKIINLLPETYRDVFKLYVIEGYSHKEIAALLKIREATSRSNLTRARAKLKDLIDDFDHETTMKKISLE